MGFELPFVIGPEYIAVALFGVVIGIIFGAIPGMTATMAVAVFLPLTYAYSMEMALYLLLGLYVGGISGGLVPAILINIPGTPSSVCTTFDGHPMALRGEGERALKIGVTSSFMGGMISLVVLALFTPILAGWAIKFSAVEKFLIILFALTVIAALSRGQMLRGLWIGMLGVLVAMMNQFSVNNEYRMVPEFLESQMQSGFQLFPVLIGLFAVSEMLQQCETGMHASYSKDDTLEVKNNVKFSLLHDFKGQIINVFRSALLGTFMGILPGVGGSAASLIAYSQAKSWSKHPELLGTGVPEGLIASETSNNGLTGGALVPLLSLGIPGDSTTAVLIGAFMLQGIQVGPLFITNNPVIWNTILGHPMALRGEGERALKIGVTSSFMGGMISLVVLALFTPILAGWAIKFSAVEKFLIILFALTVIAALSRGQMLRGLWIGMLGVLVAMMNQFSVNNEYRMVPEFLESQMQSGFQLFPVLIGLFAVSEMLQQCETGMHASYSKDDTLEVKNNVKFSLLHDFKGQIINVFRSALLGTFMGILPGVGGSAASLIAYSQAKSWSKHPELLGTGVPEGLIASETSNNGLTGGALVPLLSLGIPGDSTTAVLIGAFMLQGIQVGPLFITNNPVIWNTILVALLCCNILMYLVMFFPVKLLAKIVLIPQERLYPVVLMMCTVGAYATLNGRMFDVWCLLLFGIVGLLIKKFHFPVSCFLIGFILGGDLEDYFIQVLTAYNGSLTGLFVRPMSWVIWALIILSVVYAVLDNRKAKRQEKELSGKQ